MPPIGEDKLAEVIGLERFRTLKVGFPLALVDIREVITEHEAELNPGMLADACDALIAQRASIKNPEVIFAGCFGGSLESVMGFTRSCSR
ncbi:MAG: hypothetical protein ABW252_26100 [Polyangiales bacterium]